MAKISVTIAKPSNRKYYLCRWLDPVTGKRKTKSTGMTVKDKAIRFAARLEDRLNNGETIVGTKTQWDLFRDRYDEEVMSGKAKRTRDKAGRVLDQVEKVIQPKSPDVIDANQISQWVKSMRKAGNSEATIKGNLAYLKATLRWAADMNIIPNAPKIKMPTRLNTNKGRAITLEEFERMLDCVEPVVEKIAADNWKFLLKGLWWSGLRRSEAWHLHWTDDSKITIELNGKRPQFKIQAEADKGFESRLFPVAPEFVELIETVPESDRIGYVFQPCYRDGTRRVNEERMSRIIGQIGAKAGVSVGTRPGVEKQADGSKKIVQVPKFASAHDLRRSFGTRWAGRDIPTAYLQKMMRHASIETTINYYVTHQADTIADAMWNAYERENHEKSNTLGNTERFEADSEFSKIDVSSYQ